MLFRSADPAAVTAVVDSSLDRKVCNTANVICVLAHRGDHLAAVLDGIRSAGLRRHVEPIVHVDHAFATEVASLRFVRHDGDEHLATEWEWDDVPETSVRLVADLDEAVRLVNRHSPSFVASVLTGSAETFELFYDKVDAPFVGNGFTRWVDGQYALNRPELGLSNWQFGRLFARSGILSGDGVYSVRHVAVHRDPNQRR